MTPCASNGNGRNSTVSTAPGSWTGLRTWLVWNDEPPWLVRRAASSITVVVAVVTDSPSAVETPK